MPSHNHWPPPLTDMTSFINGPIQNTLEGFLSVLLSQKLVVFSFSLFFISFHVFSSVLRSANFSFLFLCQPAISFLLLLLQACCKRKLPSLMFTLSTKLTPSFPLPSSSEENPLAIFSLCRLVHTHTHTHTRIHVLPLPLLLPRGKTRENPKRRKKIDHSGKE